MAAPLEVADVTTPIGTFWVAYQGSVVTALGLHEVGRRPRPVPAGARRRRPPFLKGSPPAQLRDYFRDGRASFEVDVAPTAGSDFDRGIWETLRRVPAGRTVTYGELGRSCGHPGAARAVGGAMARNPIPIIIPCHRVVGEGGSITGFGLGLWRKRWLLDHEGAWPLRSRSADGPRPGGQRTLEAFPDSVTLTPAPRRRRDRPRRPKAPQTAA